MGTISDLLVQVSAAAEISLRATYQDFAIGKTSKYLQVGAKSPEVYLCDQDYEEYMSIHRSCGLHDYPDATESIGSS